MNNAWVKPKNPFYYLFDVLSPFILGVVSSDLNLEKIIVRHECSQTGCALTTTTSDTWNTILTRLLQIHDNKALSALFTNYQARENVPLYIGFRYFSVVFQDFLFLGYAALCLSDWSLGTALWLIGTITTLILTALQWVCFNSPRNWPWKRAPQHLPKQSDKKTITYPAPRYLRIIRASGSLLVFALNFFSCFLPLYRYAIVITFNRKKYRFHGNLRHNSPCAYQQEERVHCLVSTRELLARCVQWRTWT